MSSKTDPLLLTSIVANIEKLQTIGKTKYGSYVVRSMNHHIPPDFMDSTGKLHILRKPTKKEMNRGTWTKGAKKLYMKGKVLFYVVAVNKTLYYIYTVCWQSIQSLSLQMSHLCVG